MVDEWLSPFEIDGQNKLSVCETICVLVSFESSPDQICVCSRSKPMIGEYFVNYSPSIDCEVSDPEKVDARIVEWMKNLG